jgi:uncharacterized YigZ family protein
MTPDLLRTAAGPAVVRTDPVKGSRFRAHVAPVADEASALAVVEGLRAADRDATHHCWAFALATGRQRASDDGEPRDTAGAPILRHLQGSGIRDVVVVVSRWYGGTKLGRGGLVRAYGDAAAAGLAAVSVVERPIVVRLQLTHPYELTGSVDAVLASHAAHELAGVYGERATRTVTVPRSVADSFIEAITEATAGQVRPNRV